LTLEAQSPAAGAMDMIFAPIVYRLLAGYAPLSKSLADALVDAALRGLAAAN